MVCLLNFGISWLLKPILYSSVEATVYSLINNSESGMGKVQHPTLVLKM